MSVVTVRVVENTDKMEYLARAACCKCNSLIPIQGLSFCEVANKNTYFSMYRLRYQVYCEKCDATTPYRQGFVVVNNEER